MAIDLEAVRADTPGCQQVAHLNNAGASLPPRPVIEAVTDYFELETTLGGYEAFARRSDQLAAVYASVARVLGCAPGDVALTGNSSESWWRAFLAVPLEPGDQVVIGRAEFVSAVAALFQAAERGVDLVVVDNGPDGVLDLNRLAEAMNPSVRLVCLTEVPMTRGVVNPIAEAVAVCRARSDALILVDGTQAVGQLPVDVTAMGCDFYTATSRKWLRGPRGVGMLYVRPELTSGSGLGGRLLDPVFVDGSAGLWSDEFRFEPVTGAARFQMGERPFPQVMGLGAACDYALQLGLDAIAARVDELARYARIRLDAVDGVTVHDGTDARGGIVGITVDGVDPVEAVHRLRAEAIHTAPPGRGASYHDLADRGLDAIVRVAPHYYNTTAEIDRLAQVIAGW